MIVGIGVDILATSRIALIIERGEAYSTRFARRVLCSKEFDQYANTVPKTERVQYLATRWCLKEALYKAAYPHQLLRWNDVSVYKSGPKPAVDVCWNSLLQGASAHVSLSHDHDLLVGFAVIEAGNRTAFQVTK